MTQRGEEKCVCSVLFLDEISDLDFPGYFSKPLEVSLAAPWWFVSVETWFELLWSFDRVNRTEPRSLNVVVHLTTGFMQFKNYFYRSNLGFFLFQIPPTLLRNR